MLGTYRELIPGWVRSRADISLAPVEGLNGRLIVTAESARGFRIFRALSVCLHGAGGQLLERSSPTVSPDDLDFHSTGHRVLAGNHAFRESRCTEAPRDREGLESPR